MQMAQMPIKLRKRIFNNLTTVGESECLLWYEDTRGLNKRHFGWKSLNTLHDVCYFLYVGEPSKRHRILPCSHYKNCFNPLHLQKQSRKDPKQKWPVAEDQVTWELCDRDLEYLRGHFFPGTLPKLYRDGVPSLMRLFRLTSYEVAAYAKGIDPEIEKQERVDRALHNRELREGGSDERIKPDPVRREDNPEVKSEWLHGIPGLR